MKNILTPSLIADITGGKYIGPAGMQDVQVSGVARDNREIKPDNIFICIQGERTDGHLYANSAFEAGASCCLAEKRIADSKGPYVLVPSTLEAIKILGGYYRKLFNIPVIGITGSVGKTTAKEMVAAALSSKLDILKTEKNLNNELGVPLTLLSLRPEHQAAVVEMGISNFGEMSSLARMARPDIFIITNIGYSHTKELGNLEGVFRAKTEALEYMKPGSTIVLNGDDGMLQCINTDLQKITFGLQDNNDYYADKIKTEGIKAITFDIVSEKSKFAVEIEAYGNHLAVTAPAAAAVGHMLGLTDTEISKGLSKYTHIDGRSNVSVINGITLINDCYNANPGSVKAALESLSRLEGRKVAILGDMLNLGVQSGKLHNETGAEAARCGIDVLICCGDEAYHIADGYKHNGGIYVRHYDEIDSLINDIPSVIKEGDAVLVKASRSMRFERVLPVISCLK